MSIHGNSVRLKTHTQNENEMLNHLVGDTTLGLDDSLKFFEIDAQDLLNLKELRAPIENVLAAVVDAFYEKLLNFAPTKMFFANPKVLDRVKKAQTKNILSLTNGIIDEDYLKNRTQVGIVHEKIGLPMNWYLASYAFFLKSLAPAVQEYCGQHKKKYQDYFGPLERLMLFDISVCVQTYLYAREEMIRRQQKEIIELSTPILKIKDQLLLVPVIGMINAQRADILTSDLLNAIKKHSALVTVVDVTGVAEIDTQTANHIILTVNACRLMGSHAIVTGISSDIATTLVKLGINFSGLHTCLDLQAGLVAAEARLEAKEIPQGFLL